VSESKIPRMGFFVNALNCPLLHLIVIYIHRFQRNLFSSFLSFRPLTGYICPFFANLHSFKVAFVLLFAFWLCDCVVSLL
jgi:hypothetical protein